MNEILAYDSFYAAGVWQRCSSNEGVPVIDPARGERRALVQLCDTGDVDVAVRAAAHAQADWALSTLPQRRQVLQSLSDALAARVDASVESFASEVGCPVSTGRFLQGLMVRDGLAALIDGIEQVAWRESVRHSTVLRAPVGVVAGITAWNAPLFQMAAKAGAAIAAGCAIVLKPSEAAPESARLFCEAVAECGLPPGVVNLVWGGPAVGEALVAHPDVALVSFTGSPAVGRRIMAQAAVGLKRVVLELGGKSAAVLLDDADVEQAVTSALRMCMTHAGQICAAQSRLVVPRDRLDEVADLLRALLPAWTVGDPHNEATRVGPLASAAQHARVRGMVEAALADGASLVAGGGPRQAPFFAPTVLQATPGQAIAREEVFGPVLTLIGHDGDEDALRITNGTPYGLSGALWSRDAQRAARLAARMRTGQVVLNGAAQNLAAPFGGVGASGFGRENGRFGIEDFLELRNLQGMAA